MVFTRDMRTAKHHVTNQGQQMHGIHLGWAAWVEQVSSRGSTEGVWDVQGDVTEKWEEAWHGMKGQRMQNRPAPFILSIYPYDHDPVPCRPLTCIAWSTQANYLIGPPISVTGDAVVMLRAWVPWTRAGPTLLPWAQHWVSIVTIQAPTAGQKENNGSMNSLFLVTLQRWFCPQCRPH